MSDINGEQHRYSKFFTKEISFIAFGITVLSCLIFGGTYFIQKNIKNTTENKTIITVSNGDTITLGTAGEEWLCVSKYKPAQFQRPNNQGTLQVSGEMTFIKENTSVSYICK
jgi:hypothetical protein